MTAAIDDVDQEVDEFWNGPAVDRALHDLGGEDSPFAELPSPTAMSQLQGAGILVRGKDLVMLQAAIRTFQSFPNIHYSPEAIEREREIASLSERLRTLLANEAGKHDGWRAYWGNADWEGADEAGDVPDPEWSINIPELRDELGYLAKSAGEHLEWLEAAKTSGFEPGSNRAPRRRYFYWVLLLAFWKYQLGREIGTCTTDDRAYGPLIDFIRIMSARGMSDEELKGTTIRAFVRNNADCAERFAMFFDRRA